MFKPDKNRWAKQVAQSGIAGKRPIVLNLDWMSHHNRNRKEHLSKSQIPLLSNSCFHKGMEGRKWPRSPVVQPLGISHMRKNPNMWSMRYAWKYLHVNWRSCFKRYKASHLCRKLYCKLYVLGNSFNFLHLPSSLQI